MGSIELCLPCVLLQGSVHLLSSEEDTLSLRDHLSLSEADLLDTVQVGPLALTLPILFSGSQGHIYTWKCFRLPGLLSALLITEEPWSLRPRSTPAD